MPIPTNIIRLISLDEYVDWMQMLAVQCRAVWDFSLLNSIKRDNYSFFNWSHFMFKVAGLSLPALERHPDFGGLRQRRRVPGICGRMANTIEQRPGVAMRLFAPTFLLVAVALGHLWPTSSLHAQETAVCDCPTCGTPRVYTSAPAFKLMCSGTWQMTSTCGGPAVDQVDKWKIAGAIPQPGWNIKPWSAKPVTLIGVELTKLLGPEHLWWMVGNGSVPDAMVFMGRSQDHVQQFFPPGFGMPFPAVGTGMPNDYIDLHGVCAR